MTVLHSGARRDAARAPSPLLQGRGGLATPASLAPGGAQLAATDENGAPLTESRTHPLLARWVLARGRETSRDGCQLTCGSSDRKT